MKADIYNQQNKVVGEIDLPDHIFKVRWNPDLVHQALSTQLANRRVKLAQVKGRGEVRGGGKKPWKQKGTGRSRQGSIRSPLWKGGGVTHGPTAERDFSKKINQKMKQAALFSVLSRKVKDNELRIIDTLEIGEYKTKQLAVLLHTILAGKKQSTVFVASAEHRNISKAVGNIQKVDSMGSKSLNVYDLMSHKNIIVEKDAIPEIVAHYKILNSKS